jgi:hypothetical protein
MLRSWWYQYDERCALCYNLSYKSHTETRGGGMKKISLFLLSIGIVAILFSGSNSFGSGYRIAAMSTDATGSSQSIQGSPYALPDQSTLSQEYKDYVFGFKGTENSCMVQKFTASSSDEALKMARNYCPTCSAIQDITSQRTRGEAPWEDMVPEAQVFCSK